MEPIRYALPLPKERQTGPSLFEQIMNRQNPDYLEVAEDGSRIEAWVQCGAGAVNVIVYSEVFDNGSWWADEIKGVSIGSLPKNENERNRYLLDQVHSRLESDGELKTEILRFASLRMAALGRHDTENQHENRRRSSRTQHREDEQTVTENVIWRAAPMAQKMELPMAQVIGMYLHEFGQPAAIQDRSVYLHGLTEHQSGTSLAVRFDIDTKKWWIANLTEADRHEYKHRFEQIIERQIDGDDWILLIETRWSRVEEEMLQELISRRI